MDMDLFAEMPKFLKHVWEFLKSPFGWILLGGAILGFLMMRAPSRVK